MEGFLKTDSQFRRECEDPITKQIVVTSGCTAIVGVLQGNLLTVANLGDCRAVLGQQGKLIPLSEDHKPTRPDEKKRIQDLGGEVLMGRVEGTLAVSRAIGDFDFKMNGKLFVTPIPDILQITLDSNSDFIIVACDGCKLFCKTILIISVGCCIQ